MLGHAHAWVYLTAACRDGGGQRVLAGAEMGLCARGKRESLIDTGRAA